MATYQSTSLQLGRPIRGPGIGGARGAFALVTVTIPASATTADVLQFVNLPTNARVIDGWIKNAGSATFTLNVGDGGDNDRFFSAQAVAAGTTVRMSVATGFNAVFTAKTLVTGALTANATAAGDVTLYLQYDCEEPV